MNREVQTFSRNNNSDDIPLWLWFCRALYNSVKDALQFLREQPRQLQYIEWIKLSEESMAVALSEGLTKKFKLTKNISTSNMHLFDLTGTMKKYDTPEQILQEFYEIRLELYVERKAAQVGSLELELLKVANKDLEQVISIVFVALFQSIVVLAPFVAFQYYGYKQLCLKEDRSRRRPWCDSTIPYIYGFVQSYYWNVGFLRYFQLKQLPNFLLATPMLVLLVCAVAAFVNRQPDLFLSLGLASPRFVWTESSYMSYLTKDCELRVQNLESMTTKGTLTKQVTDSHHHTGTLKRRKSTVKAQGGVSDDQDENCVEKGFDSPEMLCFL